ncbi:50S ribosomal protein L19 [candidate division WOR-3 bacterium]|nr:50S ribosomal protein L19 [candidate division WOR-3 bacterium]
MNKLTEIENQMLRSDLEEFGPGDTVKVFFRVHEGKKEKVQAFQGVCIQIRGSGPNRSFTLRKISQGIGIERIFPLHSPVIEKVEVVRYGKVRRAKLYYLREKVGKGRYVKERVVRKKGDVKKKPKVTAKAVGQEAIEEVSEAAEDVVTKQTPPEAPSKEATDDAATKSGSRGVEEG